MKVKELIDKLSKLDDDVEVKIGYGDKANPINFISPRNNYIVLHSHIYYGNKYELWAQTLFNFHKKDNDETNGKTEEGDKPFNTSTQMLERF